MSGGGHRAALFGAGALLYLVDSGKSGEITSIASVSGGSLTNGFVAQSVDLSKATPQDFESRIKPLIRCIAQQGTVLPPSPFTLAYLVLLALLLLGSVVGVWFIPIPIGWRVALFFAGLLLTGLVAGQRGRVTSRAFARRLFSPQGRPTRLEEASTSVDHVICAADLHTGENVYFSGRFVSSYRFGWGSPGDLPLHVAVQCSAALPGAFPPNWLPTARHRFHGGLAEAKGAGRMVLVDGGVYDNQADQWVIGMDNRRRRFGSLANFRDADELVSVNASGGLGWTAVSNLLRFPLLGEFLSLLRDKSILYDNGNSVRRELLIQRFERPAGTTPALRGALVHIPRTPLHTARRYLNGPDPAAAARAGDVIARLEPNEGYWKDLAARAGGVKTSLTKLGTESAADVLEHAYVLAMANLHVILGYPLLDLPSRARFEALAS